MMAVGIDIIEKMNKLFCFLSIPINSLTHAKCDTRSISKWSLIGLKDFLSFPFSRLVASKRLKSPVYHTIYHSWRENSWIHTFTKSNNAM